MLEIGVADKPYVPKIISDVATLYFPNYISGTRSRNTPNPIGIWLNLHFGYISATPPIQISRPFRPRPNKDYAHNVNTTLHGTEMFGTNGTY